MLQVIPNFAYIDWLVERFRMEQPFVQYHAGVALLSTVRSREVSLYREKLRHMLLIAKDYLGSSPGTTDREAVLEAALRELDLRS